MNRDKQEHERLQSEVDGLVPTPEEQAAWKEHRRRYDQLWEHGEQEQAHLAAEGAANSLRARCAELVLSRLGPAGPFATPVGTLPDPSDRRHYVGDYLAPAPPDVAVKDHWGVLQQWQDEEAVSQQMVLGVEYDQIIRAARHLTARRLLLELEEADCRLRADGDQLWIGPRSKVPAEAVALGKMVRPELLELVRQKEAAHAAAPAQGPGRDPGAAPGRDGPGADDGDGSP